MATRTFGAPGQGQIKAETIQAGLSAIRSVHVDMNLDLSAFESPLLQRILQGARTIQGPSRKKKAEPLSADQLRRITKRPPAQRPRQGFSRWLDNLHFDTAIKLAFAGFFRTREITYEEGDLRNLEVFRHTRLQRRDVIFADNFEHATIHLRSSKSDYEHKGVDVIVSRTGSDTCPVEALKSLFDLDPQPPTSPLLRHSRGAFSRERYVGTLRDRLRRIGCANYMDFAGHSPRRGGAQRAADLGMLEEDIQILGRWTSNAFKGYYKLSAYKRYSLNYRFLTGKSRPLLPD